MMGAVRCPYCEGTGRDVPDPATGWMPEKDSNGKYMTPTCFVCDGVGHFGNAPPDNLQKDKD